MLRGQNGCWWAAKQTTGEAASGCAFNRTGDNRFTFRWSPLTSTLTMVYDSGPSGPGVDATVTLVARSSAFDVRLELESAVEYPLSGTLFPADLLLPAADVRGAYMPTFLPGTRLLPGFFNGPHRNVETYPSRWAFADYLSADIGKAHVAVYSVNPAPKAIAPVDIGFVRHAEGAPCGGPSSARRTSSRRGWSADRSGRAHRSGCASAAPWSSRSSAYRDDNGIDDYPSLADKVGARLDTLVRCAAHQGRPLEGAARVQPVGGASCTSCRRPRSSIRSRSSRADSTRPTRTSCRPIRAGARPPTSTAWPRSARSLGQLVMPYLNVSWWDTTAPSVQALPSPLEPKDIAVQNLRGNAVTEQFGPHDGYIVSPHAPAVRKRIEGVFEEWKTDVPADCLFFDQIGARPWRRDFNPAAPTRSRTTTAGCRCSRRTPSAA